MLNLKSTNEHVPKIEHHIRVVKEHCRATWHRLPFNRIPKLLTIHIVLNAVKLLNFFPMKGGISDTLSPKTIMSGETLDYKKHLHLQIGQYCQVHEEDTPRNSRIPCTKGAICLARLKQEPARWIQVHGSQFWEENYPQKLGCHSHAGYGDCPCQRIGQQSARTAYLH